MSDPTTTTDPREVARSPGERGRPGSPRIHGTLLVMEDEDGIRFLIETILGGAGYLLLLAGDGREGLDLFRRHSRDVSAVLLDVTMPHLSGPDVVHLLRIERPDLPVMAMSGLGESDMRHQFVNQRVDLMLEKPFLPADLLKAVGSLLAH